MEPNIVGVKTTDIDQDTDVIVGLLEFVCLPREALSNIIHKMHTGLYGYDNDDISDWDTTELLCWFKSHYTFDQKSCTWIAMVTIERLKGRLH